MCAGIAAQKKADDLGLRAVSLMSVEAMDEVLCSSGLADISGQNSPSELLHEDVLDHIVAYDDLSGEELDPKLMVEARKDEIKYFREMGVYDKVAISECYEKTGKAPIAVRWVDVNKGDSVRPNYRSRLVAKEFRTDVKPELYAATPPSECLRLLLSILASSKGTSLMYADVSRAYFYA